MTGHHAHFAYSLEIAVSDRHAAQVAFVASQMTGPVVVRDDQHPEPGWTRLVLLTDGEQHLHELESRLRASLDFHLVYCEDRVPDRLTLRPPLLR